MKKKLCLVIAVLVMLVGCGQYSGSGKNNEVGLLKTGKTSELFRSERMPKPIYLSNGFVFDSGLGIWGNGPLYRSIVKKSIEAYGLGEIISPMPVGAREWGYTFFLPTDVQTGDGTYGMGGFRKTPKTKKDALSMLKEQILDHYQLSGQKQWESCTGHYLWQHYACEWGCTSVGSEVGETISSTQSHIAFCRGAARQFGLPWHLQFSFWHDRRINDYTDKAVWGDFSTAFGGHSPSLYRRTFLAGYMGGMSHFYAEAGAIIDFVNQLTEDGYYALSPVGKVTQELVSFAKRHPDIGTTYIPFGVVLDHEHGMFSGDERITKRSAFQVFPYTKGDQMSYELLDLFFPGSWIVSHRDESTYLVNSPYGDTCDVLLQNAPAEVLNRYPCLILSGDITLSVAEAKRYSNYVSQGGTLLLNTAYLSQFTEINRLYRESGDQEILFGKGRVIVYGPDYTVNGLKEPLRMLIKEWIPFSFSEEVEYILNRKDNALILTLINNEGYYWKNETGHVERWDSVPLQCTVSYTGVQSVATVREWRTDTELPNRGEWQIDLSPGEVKILEFRFDFLP